MLLEAGADLLAQCGCADDLLDRQPGDTGAGREKQEEEEQEEDFEAARMASLRTVARLGRATLDAQLVEGGEAVRSAAVAVADEVLNDALRDAEPAVQREALQGVEMLSGGLRRSVLPLLDHADVRVRRAAAGFLRRHGATVPPWQRLYLQAELRLRLRSSR